MKFKGWTSAEEKVDAPTPWADFELCLYSSEIGEVFQGKDVKDILKVSGYRIKLEKIK